jgi:2-keto-3-deoxy-6-phosphogluconate aldolase
VVLEAGKETAIGEMVAEAEQMGADVVIGVDVDYESIQVGQGTSMLMISASGTPVKLKQASRRRCSTAKLTATRTATGPVQASTQWTRVY